VEAISGAPFAHPELRPLFITVVPVSKTEKLLLVPNLIQTRRNRIRARCDNKIHQLSMPVRADSDMLISMVLEQPGRGTLSIWALK
jgi:hypothetical protein